jgi:hypothetical protein
VAEYATANKLVSEPAFTWWAKDVLRKRERILSKLNTRYVRSEEKFGITIPKSVREALELDMESNTTYWADSIRKEMAVIMPAVRIIDEESKPPVGYQEIPCHMVFDVKVDFTHKA